MPLWMLLAIHTAVTAAWLLSASRFRRTQQAACEALVIFLLPILGLILLAAWRTACLISHCDANRPSYEKEERDPFSPGTMEYQADIVPLSDTYLLGDAKMKRRLFTDAIKQEVVENPAILQQAVHDEDREITYYAVSMMTAHMGKLAEEISSMKQELAGGRSSKTRNSRVPEELAGTAEAAGIAAEETNRDELLQNYTNRMETYLGQGYGDASGRAAMEADLRTALTELVERHPEDADIRERQIRAFLRAKDYESAAKACTDYAAAQPETEGPVYMRLVLATAQRDVTGVKQALAALRALPVRLSPRALTAIRYWGEAAHE